MRKRGGHPGKDRQFCDTGHQYRSAIFYNTEEQQRLALQSRAVDRCRRGDPNHHGFPHRISNLQ
jgi:peptide methionine sulfoxide reductase MsrA